MGCSVPPSSFRSLRTLPAGFADGCYSPLPTPSPTRTVRSSLVFHNITYFPFLRRRLLGLLRFFLGCTLSTQTKISRLNDCCKPALSFFYTVTCSSCSPRGFGLQEESNDTERFSFSDSGLKVFPSLLSSNIFLLLRYSQKNFWIPQWPLIGLVSISVHPTCSHYSHNEERKPWV